MGHTVYSIYRFGRYKTATMLPILAVLLGVAQCAVAAPSVVGVTPYLTSQYPVVPDSGRFVNSFLIDGSSAYLDSADLPFYFQMVLEALKDMSNSADVTTQAAAVVSNIALLGESVSGIPGDSCDTADFIKAYAYALSTGNNAGLKQALANYVRRLIAYIDLIVQLIVNPSSVKYTVGPSGSCLGGGRTFPFEQVWDAILNNANAYQIILLNEIYCTSRRMHNSFGIRSNNAAAGVTAANIPVVTQLAKLSLNSLVPFLRAVANGSNPTQVAVTAKAGLSQALTQVSV